MPERIRLRIGNMGKVVLVSGQAYQDPKDALNELVSNAADEYAEAGTPGERIRIVLRRRGRYPVIAVEDAGRAWTPTASAGSPATCSTRRRRRTRRPSARKRSGSSPSSSSEDAATS